jgi:hypothetical protein
MPEYEEIAVNATVTITTVGPAAKLYDEKSLGLPDTNLLHCRMQLLNAFHETINFRSGLLKFVPFVQEVETDASRVYFLAFHLISDPLCFGKSLSYSGYCGNRNFSLKDF